MVFPHTPLLCDQIWQVFQSADVHSFPMNRTTDFFCLKFPIPGLFWVA